METSQTEKNENEEPKQNNVEFETSRNIPSVNDSGLQVGNFSRMLLQKINYLTNLFHFTQNYSTSTIQIYSKLSEIVNKKISNTLNQNKNYLKFFKEITSAYQRFSTDLIKANTELSVTNAAEHIISGNINQMIGLTQETIANNFYGFSNVLLNSIVTKGPLKKIEAFYKRLSSTMKEINRSIGKLETRREKILKRFNLKYEPVFEQFKKHFNSVEGLSSDILHKNDFYLIEMDLITNFNLMYGNIVEFLTIFKKCMTDVRTIVLDYLNLVKESMEIYINENRKIFAGNMNLNFETIHQFYESISKESIEVDLSVSKILREEEVIKQFDELLKNYQLVFVKYNFVKKDDIINNDEKFKIANFKTMDEFVNLFETLNPDKFEQNDSELVDINIELKRDPGIFQGWKMASLIITKQKNVLIFDEEINTEKYLNALNLKNLQMKIKEDKKNPYRFELCETKKGMIFNSSVSFSLDAMTREKYDEVKKLFEGNISENPKNI